jgi:hypothetical protein
MKACLRALGDVIMPQVPERLSEDDNILAEQKGIGEGCRKKVKRKSKIKLDKQKIVY